MNVGSIFSGIGGFDLGLERAGMSVVWQCESDDFCRRVLAHHWPDVPCFEDVCGLSSAAGTPQVDVLCGGFPCQDISYAGLGAGITGARSGLWSEYARLIGELEPRWVIVENVAALLARGLSVVLADLSALGYDAEWDCLPASAFGAPHQRDRVWIVGYPNSARSQGHGGSVPRPCERTAASSGGGDGAVADANGIIRDGRSGTQRQADRRRQSAHGGSELADACRVGRRPGSGLVGGLGTSERGGWSAEPDVGRVAHGVPQRVDRLRALGNALVPQIAQWIGERIMSYEEMTA